ncbi:MAG: hypothetical protein R3F42_10175 [Pseudomonadota bacterium]
MKIRVELNLELGLQEFVTEQTGKRQPEIPLRLQQTALPGLHEPRPAGPAAVATRRVH